MKYSGGEINIKKTSETSRSTSSFKVTKQTRWIFSLLGMWSMIKNNTTTFKKRLSIPIFLINQSFFAIVIIPAFIQLFCREKNVKIKLAYAGALGFTTICAVKCLTIIHCRQKIRKCIEQIENDWDETVDEADRIVMIKNMNIGKKITIFCGVFMYSGGILHQSMMPFLPGSIVSILDNSSNRLLVYPVYDIIDKEISPTYEILYCIHIITGIIACTISTGMCNLSILFITHVVSQNEIMVLKLTKLINIHDGSGRNTDKKIAELIDFHLKIIKFSSDVEKCLREICMVPTFEALCIICFAEYYALTIWKYHETFGVIIYLCLIQAFIGNFFIFCYVGEISKEQFRKTGEAVYMTEWYRLSNKNARHIILIIAATQRSPKITAGGLIELSYNGFVSIIKTTTACFNLLRIV